MEERFDQARGFRRTDAYPSVTGIVPRTESGQLCFYDGAGNKITLIDTTAGNVSWSLLEPKNATALLQTVKRITGGANTLTVSSVTGNIDGAASKSIPTQYQSFTFISDGTNYWII